MHSFDGFVNAFNKPEKIMSNTLGWVLYYFFSSQFDLRISFKNWQTCPIHEIGTF